MTLRYIASQERLSELSDIFEVTEYSLFQSKRQIIYAIINSLLSKFIKWPENADMVEISNKFNDIE